MVVSEEIDPPCDPPLATRRGPSRSSHSCGFLGSGRFPAEASSQDFHLRTPSFESRNHFRDFSDWAQELSHSWTSSQTSAEAGRQVRGLQGEKGGFGGCCGIISSMVLLGPPRGIGPGNGVLDTPGPGKISSAPLPGPIPQGGPRSTIPDNLRSQSIKPLRQFYYFLRNLGTWAEIDAKSC